MRRRERRSERQPRSGGGTSALYVQIPTPEAEKLDRAAFELKAHKRDIVAGLVAHYVDPTTRAGLERLRALAAGTTGSASTEIPPRPPPERHRDALREPTIRISRASEWAAGMQRSIRDFARSRACPSPLVRVTLDDGEQLFLGAITPGPDDEFVTFEVYERSGAGTRLVVLPLDAIRKLEIVATPPSAAEETFVFRPREVGVGFVQRGD